jgi:hypothetical protein
VVTSTPSCLPAGVRHDGVEVTTRRRCADAPSTRPSFLLLLLLLLLLSSVTSAGNKNDPVVVAQPIFEKMRLFFFHFPFLFSLFPSLFSTGVAGSQKLVWSFPHGSLWRLHTSFWSLHRVAGVSTRTPETCVETPETRLETPETRNSCGNSNPCRGKRKRKETFENGKMKRLVFSEIERCLGFCYNVTPKAPPKRHMTRLPVPKPPAATTMYSPARRQDRQDGEGLVRRELKTPKRRRRDALTRGRDDARTTPDEQVS